MWQKKLKKRLTGFTMCLWKHLNKENTFCREQITESCMVCVFCFLCIKLKISCKTAACIATGKDGNCNALYHSSRVYNGILGLHAKDISKEVLCMCQKCQTLTMGQDNHETSV